VFQLPVGKTDFLILNSILQSGSGAHPASYSHKNKGSFGKMIGV